MVFTRLSAGVFLSGLAAALCLGLSGCNYDFPLTAKPTQKVDARLLGDWATVAPENQKPDRMQVRQLDDFNYLVAMDDINYRVFHSDVAQTAFLSVQERNAAQRPYIYLTWKLSPDGAELTLRSVSTKVVPESTKSAADAQRLIKANLAKGALFNEPLTFRRAAPRTP